MIKAEWTNKDSLDLQPTCNQLATTDGNLINRQAAIDALGEAPEVWTDSPEEFAALSQWEMDVTAIKALPSAEPPYQYSEAYVKQIRAERDYLQELVNDMALPKTGGNTNANEIYNYLKERIGDTVDDMKEFDAWFERMVWHVKECDRLTAESKRVKGRWIEMLSYMNHTYKCSECGRLLVNVTDGKNNVSEHYPYCHCGADMRGEQDDKR